MSSGGGQGPNISSTWSLDLSDLEKLREGISQGAQHTEGFLSKWSEWGNVVSGLRNGIDLLKDFAGTIKGAVTGAIDLAKGFAEFRSGAAEIKTLGIDKSIGDISEEIRALTTQFGGENQATIKAYYDSISAGIPEDKIVAFQEVVGKLATVARTDLATATDLLTSSLNAFGETADNASVHADSFFAAVQAGKTTIPELSQAFGQVGPTAAAAGLSLQETAAAMASMTVAGIKTDQAATSLKAALSNIIKPGQESSAVAQALGIEFDTTALKTKGLGGFLADVTSKIEANKGAIPGLVAQMKSQIEANEQQIKSLSAGKGASEQNSKALEELKDKNKALGEQMKTLSELEGKQTIDVMGKLFGSVEALNGVMVLAKNGGADFTKTLDGIKGKSGEVSNQFKIMEEENSFKAKQLTAAFQDMRLEVGEKLQPAYGYLLEKGQDVVSMMRDWIEANGEWLSAKITDAVKELVDWVGGIATTIRLTVEEMGGWGRITEALMNAFVTAKDTIVPAVEGIIAIIRTLASWFDDTNPSALRMVVSGTLTAIGAAWTAVETAIGKTVQTITQVITDFINVVVKLFKGEWGAAWEILKDIPGNAMKALLGDALWKSITDFISGWVDTITGFFTRLYEKVKGAMDLLVNAVTHPLDTIKSAMNTATDLFRSLFGESLWIDWFNRLRDTATETWGDTANEIEKSIQKKIGSLNTYTSHLKEFIANTRKRYDESLALAQSYNGENAALGKVYTDLLDFNRKAFESSYGKMVDSARTIREKLRGHLEEIRKDHELALSDIRQRMEDAFGHSWYPDLMGRMVEITGISADSIADKMRTIAESVTDTLETIKEGVGEIVESIEEGGDGGGLIVEKPDRINGGDNRTWGSNKDDGRRIFDEVRDSVQDLTETVKDIPTGMNKLKDLGKLLTTQGDLWAASTRNLWSGLFLMTDAVQRAASALDRIYGGQSQSVFASALASTFSRPAVVAAGASTQFNFSFASANSAANDFRRVVNAANNAGSLDVFRR